MFNFLKQDAFGIDLSDFSVKLAKLKKDGEEIILDNYCRCEIPRGLIESGEIKEEGALADLIKKIFSTNEGKTFKTRNCIASLPETEAFIQLLKLPKMKEEEIAEAIKWEIENNIPLSINEVYFDWQVIPPIKKDLEHTHVLVAAISKKQVDPYLSVFKKAGLKPLVFEVESIATARSLIKEEIFSDPVMIVDFGAKRTSFIIFSGWAVQFTASSSVSNFSLIGDIARSLNISEEKARKLKIEIGLDRILEDGRVFEALKPGLEELAGKIKNYMDFYRTHGLPDHSEAMNVSKIILCGGGANLAGLTAFLENELTVRVELGNPWINILKGSPGKIPSLPYEQSISYATVLGLALRGLK
jgi:type IV pilus assembly protein PilM